MRSTCLEKEARSRGRRGVVLWKIEVLNQHDRVVQEGVTVTLIEGVGANSAAGSVAA